MKVNAGASFNFFMYSRVGRVVQCIGSEPGGRSKESQDNSEDDY